MNQVVTIIVAANKVRKAFSSISRQMVDEVKRSILVKYPLDEVRVFDISNQELDVLWDVLDEPFAHVIHI